jgi:hypothetical protein
VGDASGEFGIAQVSWRPANLRIEVADEEQRNSSAFGGAIGRTASRKTDFNTFQGFLDETLEENS